MNLLEYRLSKIREEKKVVVIGCGRSGTLYMSKVLKILGLKVGHEKFERNGISSWYIVEPHLAEKVRGILRGHNVTYIHIVRNPLDVISSMNVCEHLKHRSGLEFYKDHFRINPNIPSEWLCVDYWIFWNKLCQKYYPDAIRIPIEWLGYSMIFALSNDLGLELTSEKYQKILNLGTKTHTTRPKYFKLLRKEYSGFKEKLTIEDINIHAPELVSKLKNMASRYGYSL